MGEVVNLRVARKRAGRQAREAAAAENRAAFGRSRAEKAQARDAAERAETFLDNHRVERPPSPDDR